MLLRKNRSLRIWVMSLTVLMFFEMIPSRETLNTYGFGIETYFSACVSLQAWVMSLTVSMSFEITLTRETLNTP